MILAKTIKVADLFCGAGGTSQGLVDGLSQQGYRVDLTAINHWPRAVETHALNHPDARHLCTGVDVVNPRDLFQEGELDILWASPECTHHSVARGGKPINDQSRATAWCVVRWAEALRPEVILVENVPEFRTWGGVNDAGKPIASKKGRTFAAWISALRSLGYRVDHRILCAADYGDPTTRKRLFVQAVRGKRRICWPEPTHAPEGGEEWFGRTQRWRGAREIIDWSLEGESIYSRKRPLAPKTLARIEAGLRKYGVGPYLVTTTHANYGKPNAANWNAHGIDDPLGSVTSATEKALVQPYLVELRGTTKYQINTSAQSCDEPVGTITSGGRHHGLCEPVIVEWDHQSSPGGYRSINSPLSTITTKAKHGIAEPMLIPQQSCGALRPVSLPAPTVSTAGAISLVEPYLVEYYGNGQAQSVDDPLPTATTKQRFGLVQPVVEIEGQRYLLDIRFRMLQPHELAAAQGFPTDYKFSGNKTEIVKQIGNAVPCGLSRALVLAVWNGGAA